MGTKINYFTMAESDYEFLKHDYDEGRYGNVMCYCAQNICERYLKHLLDIYVNEVDMTYCLKTHNLKVIRTAIVKNLPDFTVDWNKILLVNGFYYDARYPGDDAMITDKSDTEVCWEAVCLTRSAVMSFMQEHEIQTSLDVKELNYFD